MKKYDVVIIGAGPGGTPAAVRLAQSGKSVLLVDDRGKPGGECLFEGCIPSKTLEQSADYFYLLKNVQDFGVSPGGDPTCDWEKVIEKKDRILKHRSEMAIQQFQTIPALTFAAGTARFLSNHKIEIASGSGDVEQVTFDFAIITVGSKAFIPPISENGVEHIWTNKEMFEEETLPSSIVIIGAGAIGIEFAQMFAKLDVNCTVIEMLDRILPPVEADFAEILHKKMIEEDGVEIHLSAKVRGIEFQNGRFETVFEAKNGAQATVVSDKVIVAAGRIANIDSINLSATEIQFDRKGINVNDFLETTVKGIYAAGDVIHGPNFAHTASAEAMVIAENILRGNVKTMDFSKNSWVLFSDPEIASAGLTAEEAVKAGHEIVTGTYDFRVDARAQINDRPFGYLRFVVEKKTERILGIHIMTEGAADIIGEAALAVSMKATLSDLAVAIHPHPTLTESFGVLAKSMKASFS